MSQDKENLLKEIANFDEETLQFILNFGKNFVEQKNKIRSEREMYMQPIPNNNPIPEVPKTSFLNKAISATKSFASRGFDNKKVNAETKSLRVLSCHGSDNLQPCPHRLKSEKFPDSFFCGACGCGDKQATQLVDITIGGGVKYSKLDFPSLNCPLTMPGFTNYEQAKENDENTRKIYIEKQYDMSYIMLKSKDTSGESENENSNNNETQ